MTRRSTAARTSLVCAMLLAAAPITLLAQAKPAAPKATPAAPAKPVAAKPAAAKPAASRVSVAPVEAGKNDVTMTGCLEADGAKYMLTDLQGHQAPKGRSWKTGFIVKTAKGIELVGTSPNVKLKESLGHKISVVGVRDDETHMKARTIKQLGSCS